MFHKKHILGVKKVVWDGLEVVWVSTDPDRSYHFTKKIFPFEVNLPFIG